MGDAHGHTPLSRPLRYLFAFPFSEAGLPYVFSKQLPDLWTIAVTAARKKSSLGRFRVGLMAEIPARENFKTTKTPKTS